MAEKNTECACLERSVEEVMQPPPRKTPPNAVGGPPPTSGPNAFRRNRRHKQAAASMAMAPPTQPMTAPFAFGRQAMPPMATEQAYFNSREPPAYVSHNSPPDPPQAASPPVQSGPFQPQASRPSPWMYDHGSPGAQFDTVENLECVPNLEVLPKEPVPHPYETRPNLVTPDQVPRPARSASVSSCLSNVSHHSGRHQSGVMGTFIQQESARPLDPGASPSAGYFEQIDSAPSGEACAFPTPSPPRRVGVFQSSNNSSFRPVRSPLTDPVAQMQPVAGRARIVMERSDRITTAVAPTDTFPGNFEQPPDDQETQFLPGSVDMGATSEVVQPPRDGPVDLQHANRQPVQSKRPWEHMAFVLFVSCLMYLIFFLMLQ